MEYVWLDSLSEDWPSQCGNSSISKLPSLEASQNTPDAARRRDFPSRIPRRTPNGKSSASRRDGSNSVLSERSANDHNITRQRLASRLSQYKKISQTKMPDRKPSISTGGSVLHNHGANLRASVKPLAETPEWKRRLLNGEVAHGEQRDLFSSACTSLQNMFKPPMENDDGFLQFDSTMPSSPPMCRVDSPRPQVHLNGNADRIPRAKNEAIITPMPSPRRPWNRVKYRLNEGRNPPSSRLTSLGRRDMTSPVEQRSNATRVLREGLAAPVNGQASSRKSSGRSDTRNERFSPILIGKRSDADGKVEFAPVEVPIEQLKQKLEALRIYQSLRGTPADLHMECDAQESSLQTANDSTRGTVNNNMTCGGRSGDSSVCQRVISAEFMVDSSDMLPEESLQASTPKQFPGTHPHQSLQSLHPPAIQLSQSPVLPYAPYPSPEKREVRQQARNKILSSPLKLFGPYDTFTNQTLLRRISQVEDTGTSRSKNETLDELRDTTEQDKSTLHAGEISQFGGGDLDGYEFADSDGSTRNWVAYDKGNIARASSLYPVPGLTPTGSSPKQGASELLVHRKRRQSLMTRSESMAAVSNQDQDDELLPTAASTSALATTPTRCPESEGKRPRTSPSKDPTPKRRRTLHPSDVAFGRERPLPAVGSASRKLQLMMGRKRKDARPGDFELADASVLASRSILWPRSSAAQPRPLGGKSIGKSPSLIFRNEGREPSQMGDAAGAERKPSIRTQDFVDQAAQIMAMIRNQVKSRANGVDKNQQDLDDSYQDESTGEPFSRPPSRDGKAWSRGPRLQEDPELIKRLQKYQEQSEAGDVISASLRSMGLEIHQDATRINRRALNIQGDIISDIPNARISSRRAEDDQCLSPNKDFQTVSSGRSISRTFPTTSSRGSESRRTIMPQSVSHLIPDRVGSMFLDKEKNVWVKSMSSPTAGIRVVEDSEDDPFASIPDLTVDLTKEMQNLRLATAQRQAAERADAETRQSPISPSVAHQRRISRGYVTLSPRERAGPHIAAAAREELEKLEERASASRSWRAKADKASDAAGGKTSDSNATKRRRNMTISFSSPIASIIHNVAAEDLDALEDDPEQQDGAVAVKSSWQQLLARANHRPASAHGVSFVPRPVSRIDEREEDSTIEIKPDYEGGQVSLVGEQSMVSHKTVDGRHGSLSFLFNHALHNGYALSLPADDSAMIGQNVGKLSLSPLSDFTVNNPDQSFGFEVSYVMGRRHMATGDGSKRVMSMTIRELVDKLSEVEPFEPYWEDMTAIDLHEKQLSSLHMLDQFCGKLVTLDASKNKLGHLDGIPSTVRELKVSFNMLTELTSWDHLMNLQYIDISGNEVRSLSALKNLVHLRSIRADDNQLTSLDGLDCHQGLLSLRARNNFIEELDFSQATFTRLSELDVDGNKITRIRHLEMLPVLSRLRLRGNCLGELRFKTSIKSLRQLDVSNNELECLDVSRLPNLRSLYADGNRISKCKGFERTRRLDSLSLREQRGETRLDLDFLSKAYEVRKLFLSGNYLGELEPVVDFLNLQLLDVASCGLQRLPAKMGQVMPNLRTLNINCNAIADLSPLEFVPRLKKLQAAGNRLADGTAVLQLLMDFPHLTQLDVRDNPVTLGFYGPLQVLVGCDDAFVLPDADAARDASFARRLDEATKLRRRLHQVALVASCRRLRKLDGLQMKRREVLNKDEVLRTLVAEGLLAEEMLADDDGEARADDGKARADETRTKSGDAERRGLQVDSADGSDETIIRGRRDDAG